MTNAAPLWDTSTEVDDALINYIPLALAGLCDGVVTLESGVPFSTSDQSAKTVLYFTPLKGACVALYDGVSAWSLAMFSEKSIKATDTQTGSTTNSSTSVTGLTDTSQLVVGMKVSGTGITGGTTIAAIPGPTSITLSANATATGSASLTFKLPLSTKYDVFGYASSGALKLELCAWTSTTVRATALTQLEGVYLKNGATTRRYLGTFITTGTDGEMADSVASRLLFQDFSLLNTETVSLGRVRGAATAAEARAATATDKALTPSNFADRAAFKAHKNGSNQASIADATPTKVTFGTEVFDRGSLFASSAWTPPAGAVRLSAQAYMTGTFAAGSVVYVAIYKNGSLLKVGGPVVAITLNNHYSQVTTTDLANGTDYYEVYVSIDVSAGTGTVDGTATSTDFCGEQI